MWIKIDNESCTLIGHRQREDGDEWLSPSEVQEFVERAGYRLSGHISRNRQYIPSLIIKEGEWEEERDED